MSEINALRKLDHPNIVRLYQYFMDQSFIYIILEKIEGSQLYDHLLGVDEGVRKNFPNIFKQILLAIQHCHSHGVVHRNITPDNILIHKSEAMGKVSYVVKLIDFSQVYFIPQVRMQERQKHKRERFETSRLKIQDFEDNKLQLSSRQISNQKLTSEKSSNDFLKPMTHNPPAKISINIGNRHRKPSECVENKN